jgi:hyperosmotically inducible periplasmic protein
MKRLAAFLIGAAFVALASACNDNTNGNANTANANLVRNANLSVNTNANTNANTSGNYNAKITKEEYEKDKERYGREAKGAGETIGSGLEDGWLWVKTKGELATVNDLRDSTINVDVSNAVVTLRGSVASADQKTKAEQAAKSVSGVKSVTDKLTVSASGNTNANNSNKGSANANTHNANHK